MSAKDHWSLLRTGNIDTGLEALKQTHGKQETPSHIMELGVAYLWAKRYEAAWEHFSANVQRYRESISDFYGMAGTAKWCLGEFDEAVQQWDAGLKAKFVDTNGLGVHLLLLLYFSAVLRPEVIQKDRIAGLLHEKVRDSRIQAWPGPIARSVLQQIDEGQLGRLCQDEDERETNDRLWLAKFYGGGDSTRTGKAPGVHSDDARTCGCVSS